MNDKWNRVNRQQPCPICHRPDWCLIATDGSAVICPRIESPKRVGEAGYLHIIGPSRTSNAREITINITIESNFSELAHQYRNSPETKMRVATLAERLGVSGEALVGLGVGWMEEQHCSTWPLCDADGKRVLGINRRFLDGSKKVIAGHKVGLYLPHDLLPDLSSEALLIVEGGSDAATGLDLGYWTVGRFSCTHGCRLLSTLVRQRRPRLVVVCADTGNEHERRGANLLARGLLPYARQMKLIAPPTPHKDLRAWRRSGGTATDLHRLIEAAAAHRLKVRVHGVAI